MNGSKRLLISATFVLIVGALSACMSSGPDDDASSISEDLCTAGSLVGTSYIGAPGTVVTWTATATCAFANPEYQFVFGNPSGAWSVAQAYSTSQNYAWNTTGLPLGNYSWQVWVREAGSPAYMETYQTKAFVLTLAERCTSTSTTASPAGSAVAGLPVTLTTTANCGAATPTYAVLHRLPSGVWQVDQGYSTSDVYVWDTTGASVGVHGFQVWTRAQGSTASYESYSSIEYSITNSSPCTSVSLSATPPNASVRGTLVNWTAAASGCGTPVYQFVIRSPAGVWSVAQGYSATPTFAWDTNSAPSGQYGFQVWARAADATVAYDTYTAIDYTVLPVAVSAPNSIVAGLNHTCVLRSGGTVNCWGYNAHGEIGNGVLSDARTPVAVTGLSGVTAIAAGYTHTCAIIAGGAVRCWGEGTSGQLGNGTTTNSSVPVAVTGLTGAVALSGGAGHTCAVLNDGSIRCWGYNSQGQLGLGNATISTAYAVPTSAVAGISTAVSVAAGYYHTCAQLRSGGVQCWGANGVGQLGNGTFTSSLSPVTVAGLADIRSLSAAGGISCAMLFDRTERCWGLNGNGQLGDGTTTNASSPVIVAGLSGAVSISAAFSHGCAVLGDGTARCWGTNVYGELGNGTTTGSLVPVTVSGVTGGASIAAGRSHSCVQISDTTVNCWGIGTSGELGNGGVSSLVPVVATLP